MLGKKRKVIRCISFFSVHANGTGDLGCIFFGRVSYVFVRHCDFLEYRYAEEKRGTKKEVIGEFRSRAVKRMCSLDCLHQEITRVLNEMEGEPEFYSLQT